MSDVEAEGLISEGIALYEDRHLRSALKKLQAGVNSADCVDPRSYIGIGQVLIDLERYDEAQRQYKLAEAGLTSQIDSSDSSPEIPLYLNDRGMTRLLRRDFELAIEDLKLAISLNDNWYPVAKKNLGRAYLWLDRPEAVDLLTESVGELPDDGGAHYWRARALLAFRETNGDVELALDELEKAQVSEVQFFEPASLNLWLARALRLAGAERSRVDKAIGDAIEICQGDIRDRRNRPMAQYRLASARLELGQHASAEAEFAQAIEFLHAARAEPAQIGTAMAGRAHALCALDRMQEAYEACVAAQNEGLESDEQRYATWATLSYVLSRLDRVDEADAYIEKAKELAIVVKKRRGQPLEGPPWSLLATEGIVRLAAAQRYRDQGSWRAAVVALENASREWGDRLPNRDPEAFAGILLAEGYARVGVRDPQNAVRAFEAAKENAPRDSIVRTVADRAARQISIARLNELPRFLPPVVSILAVLIIAGSTALESLGRLDAAAWATVVLASFFIGIAAWCLPSIRTFKVGGAEFTKETTVPSAASFPQLTLAPVITVPGPSDWPDVFGSRTRALNRLLAPADEKKRSPGTATLTKPDSVPLETAIAQVSELANKTESDRRVREGLETSTIWALGQPAGPDESDLLHFSTDEASPRTLLPIFTDVEPMTRALSLQEDWQQYSVLELEGRVIVENIDADVYIIVNPWTPELEYELPSRDSVAADP